LSTSSLESPDSESSDDQLSREEQDSILWDDLVQNGYPSRRRSLVGDARFETQVNKENKRNWLEEIRQLSRDSELSEDDLLLVDETIPAIVEEKESFGDNKTRKDEREEAAGATTAEADAKPEETTLVLTLKDKMFSFGNILSTIDVSNPNNLYTIMHNCVIVNTYNIWHHENHSVVLSSPELRGQCDPHGIPSI